MCYNIYLIIKDVHDIQVLHLLEKLYYNKIFTFVESDFRAESPCK